MEIEKVYVESTLKGWRKFKPRITEEINKVVRSHKAKSIPVSEIHISINDKTIVFNILLKDSKRYEYLHFTIDNDTISRGRGMTISPAIVNMEPTSKISPQEAFNTSEQRWAEHRRPKQQIKLRLEPDLIEEVEEAARKSGLNRTDWITYAIKRALEP